MSFAACLAKLKSDGVIQAAQAKRFEALYADMESSFRKRFGDSPAAVLAGEETIKVLEFEAALRRRQAALQIDRQRQAYADMEAFKGGDGAAIRAMMGDDVRAAYGNVERSAERIEYQAHAMLADFIERHRRNLLGQAKDKAGLLDVVREMHGQRSGNENAAAFAKAIGEVFESLRQRFNAAGGDIGHIANYGMPHAHDARRVRATAFDQWRSDILPELDVSRMVDPKTNGPFTDAALDEFLRAVYQNIRTDGLAGLQGSSFGGGRKLANRRSDHRFLHFKDGDAWLRYNAKYGTGDPFSAIMGHVQGMAKDVALLERFGPSPDNTVSWLIDQMERRSAQSDDMSAHALNAPRTEAFAIEQMWKTVSGNNDVPLLGGPIRSTIIKGVHGTRDLLTAAFLGSSPLSAISDANTIRMTKSFNGLPHTSTLMGYLRQLNPASAADRKLAVTLELGMRDATQAMLGLNRYFGQSQSPAVMKVIADSALRITGINKFTEAGQRSFGLAFLGELANMRGKQYGKLRPALRDALMRYGLDEAAWDVMRASPVHAERGGEWMSGRLITDRAIGDRMMDMVLAETVAAVQVQTAHSRALTNWGPQGSLQGEASRNLLQFKTFTAAIMMTQGQRIMAQGPLHGALYFANFLIGMTVFGAATTQLREIIKGNDPLPMDNAGFWGQALLQGGGIGILGDLIYSFKNDHGGGIPGLVAGPWVGAANDIGGKAAREIRAVAAGKDTHFGRDATDIMRRYLPGSSTWYLRLAFQRLVTDQLQALVDPTYRQSWARERQRIRRDGTEQWAPRGATPDEWRAPDFSNALGETMQ